MHTSSSLIGIPPKNSVSPESNAQPSDPLEGGAAFSDIFADQTLEAQPETNAPHSPPPQDTLNAPQASGFPHLQDQIQPAPGQQFSFAADTQLVSLTVGSQGIDPATLPLSGIDTEAATLSLQSEVALETVALDTAQNQPVATPETTEALLKAAPDIASLENQLGQAGQAPHTTPDANAQTLTSETAAPAALKDASQTTNAQQAASAKQGQAATSDVLAPTNVDDLASSKITTSTPAENGPATPAQTIASAPAGSVTPNIVTGTPTATPGATPEQLVATTANARSATADINIGTADLSSAPAPGDTGAPINTPLATASAVPSGSSAEITPSAALSTPTSPQIGTSTSALGAQTAAEQLASAAVAGQTTGQGAGIETAVSPTPIDFSPTADAPPPLLSSAVPIDAQAIDAAATDVNAGTALGTATGAVATTTPQTTLTPASAIQNSPIIAKPNDIPVIISESFSKTEPGQDRLVVQLDPPELGRVTIDFKFDGQVLNGITITGETPEALRQLRNMHFELIQTLEENGLSSKDLDFQQEQSPHDQLSTSRQDRLEGEEQSESSAPQAWQSDTDTPRNQSIDSASGLNIKV